MFFILKLALLTCAFYLAANLLIAFGSLLIVRWKGEFLVYGTRWSLSLLFGLVWFLSFQIAWHLALPPKVPR
jgi:predicted cobalt transporter CbtA